MKPGDLVRVLLNIHGFASQIYFSSGDIGLIIDEIENDRNDGKMFRVYFSVYSVVEEFHSDYIEPLEIGRPE